LQDPIHWTQKLPSTAIMGLILTTSLLIFILILDALRNQISIHLKHNCTTKQDKKEKQESDQQRNISRTEESDNMWKITGSIIWNKEKEPPEYETITENTEADTLLTTEELNHQTKQEIKDLQRTVEFPERNNSTLPPHAKLTEAVNYLREGRHVADTLWSVHTLHETPIC